MKCEKCGEGLDVSPEKSINFCSNCGNKVAVKFSAPGIDSAESALRYIADNFGADVLLGSKIVSCFADITRNQLGDEKDLIKILCDKGALECLKDAIQKSASEQEIAIKRAMAKLPKFLQGSEDVEIMLRKFAVALGWQLLKPQPAPTPKALAPRQTVKLRHTLKVALSNASAESVNLSARPSIGSIIKVSGIDWRVLDLLGNKALLISEKILKKRPYNIEPKDITWENCSLRKYLNNEFYNKLGAAKASVAEIRNLNPNNPWYGTAGGNDTTDKIFLLSLDEVCRYFGDSTAKLRNGRKNDWYFTDENNPNRIANYRNKMPSWWWLRSPGDDGDCAASVDDVGDVDVDGDDVDDISGGVRPALWLKL